MHYEKAEIKLYDTQNLTQPISIPNNGSKKILTEQDVDLMFEDFLVKGIRCKTEQEKDLIRKAYNFAKKIHHGAKRYSGDAFIFHPVEVARIVVEDMSLSATSAISAILHDIVDYADYNKNDIEALFGKDVADIVDGLARIKGTSEYFKLTEAEVYRKVLLGLSCDVRVVFVKLADRLHNMRTLYCLHEEKQMKVAHETMYVYAPLAHRLGLYRIKSELEDLAFKYTHYSEFQDIVSKIKDTERQNINAINKLTIRIIHELTQAGFSFDIKSRQKSVFSIWSKMTKKNIPYEMVYDVLAVRIIFNPASPDTEIESCQKIMEIITGIYPELTERRRNWLGKNRKNDGYEALHTTVLPTPDHPIEVQIRSIRMHEIAEFGMAAHWKYKGVSSMKEEFDKEIEDLKTKLEDPKTKDSELLQKFKFLFSSEITVYTPKGDDLVLQAGATALDFAFALDKQLAFKSIAAKVNYKLVRLNQELQSGDIVEIITSNNQKPQPQWFDFVKTTLALNELDTYFKRGEQLIQDGKDVFGKLCNDNKVENTDEVLEYALEKFKIQNKNEFFVAIAIKKITNDELDRLLISFSQKKDTKFWSFKIFSSSSSDQKNHPLSMFKFEHGGNIDEIFGQAVHIIAGCCNPIPGDSIVAFHKEEKAFVIHKSNCQIINELKIKSEQRIYDLQWFPQSKTSFPVTIEFQGIDKVGSINQITTIIAKNFGVNIKSMFFDSNDGIFSGYMQIYILDTKHLDELMRKLKNLPNLIKVERTDSINGQVTN